MSQINPVHTTPFYLSKISFNIISPPTYRSSQSPLSSWLSHQSPVCIPLLPHACYTPCSSHPPLLDHYNYIWQRVQVIKFMQAAWEQFLRRHGIEIVGSSCDEESWGQCVLITTWLGKRRVLRLKTLTTDGYFTSMLHAGLHFMAFRHSGDFYLYLNVP
jgi:hypothetical protein